MFQFSLSIIVVKHGPKVLYMKEMDVGFSCWWRCTKKSSKSIHGRGNPL